MDGYIFSSATPYKYARWRPIQVLPEKKQPYRHHLLKSLLSEKSKRLDQTPFNSGVNNLNGRFQILPPGPISSVIK